VLWPRVDWALTHFAGCVTIGGGGALETGLWVKRWATAFAVALACLWALSLGTASAQEARDPLIVPDEGSNGSRFQIVGQYGWTPGETVTISLAFTQADPLKYGGPFEHEREVTVLRDGTWSFPVSVSDDLLSRPLDDIPGYIVVRAQSPTKTALNAFIFSPDGRRPVGADAIAELGFGPPRPDPTVAGTLALFLAGAGALLVASGAGRRRAIPQ